MKFQRVVAATTLTLLASAMAIAKPAGPAKIGVTPESSAGCPIPTLAQCKDPTYLENDRCGKLQRVNQWTCTSLLKNEMDKAKDERGEEYSPLPKNLDDEEEGVGKVVKDTSAHGKNQFTADLYSYTSRSTARDYGITDVLGIDPYPVYAANKNVVESCDEYAYEKFLDVSEFNRAVKGDRNDSLAALRVAYGPGNDLASIGTRHLADPKLRGRDGRVFGTILEGQRNKNLFWNIPPNPALPNQEPTPAAPNLILSLGKVGANHLLAKTYKPGGTVDNTWAAHRQYGMNLLYIPPKTDPQKTLAIGPIEPDTHTQIANTFGKVPGKDPHRKRLARELDELFELQERFRSKLHEWSRLNQRYEGSGWSYVKLDGAGGDGVTFPPGHVPFNPGLALGVNPPKKDLGLKAAPSGPKPPVHQGDIAIEDPETVQRKRVLADMLAILEKADDEGCLEEGITGCDWSPKLFARAIRNTYADAQDKAFESCQALTKGSIENAKNLNLVYVDDKDYPQFACSIKTGDKITAQQLDDLPGQHEHCVKQKAEYEKQKAHDEAVAAAKARVLLVADLVDSPGDKSTPPKFKWPHLSKTRDEKMGGEKFNMGYAYDFGFDMNAQTDICKFTLDTHANFNTYATVFGERFDIIDAEAKFETTTGEVAAHAKFGTYNLFSPPVDKKFSTDDAKWEWSVTKTVGSGKKDIQLFADWMVIVVIPVKIAAGISGEAGLDTGLKLEAQGFDNKQCPSVSLSGIAEPFAEINGYLEAGIDIFVASVGIRGELTIVRASLPFKAGIGAELLKKEGSPLDPTRLNFFTRTSMDLDISTLSGSISVYGKVGWCPFCVKGEKEIASFEGPHYTQNIFDKKYEVNLNDLAIAMGLVK